MVKAGRRPYYLLNYSLTHLYLSISSDYFYSFIVFPSSSSFNCWSRAALILGWTTYNGVSSPAKGSFVKRMALMMEMVHEISEIIVNPFPYTGWTAPSSSGDNYPAHELGDQCSNYYSQLSTSSETCAYSGKNCGTVGANVNTQINGHWYILPALYDWRRNSCANSPSVSSVTAKTQTGLTYYGCYNDGPTRTLAPYQQTGWTGMTTEMCISKCKSLGYALAGVSFGNECYCGNSINGQNGGPADSATCNMACAGNANQQCGGSWRMNIYSTH